MKIHEARKLLTKPQMDQVTEKALEVGPFVVENVRKVSNHTEVAVRYPQENNLRKTIIIGG
jgi:hypothetical protein